MSGMSREKKENRKEKNREEEEEEEERKKETERKEKKERGRESDWLQEWVLTWHKWHMHFRGRLGSCFPFLSVNTLGNKVFAQTTTVN